MKDSVPEKNTEILFIDKKYKKLYAGFFGCNDTCDKFHYNTTSPDPCTFDIIEIEFWKYAPERPLLK